MRLPRPRAIIGAQSQQLSPSLLALSQRTAGRPTAAALERSLLEMPRELVRTWGQRGTVHVYAAADDWALVVYLASDESSFVTGQVLSPNGGIYVSH